jgi:organic radical activating enzyme
MIGAGAAITIDIELTNHCNAACSFCPRDAMPALGTMRDSVFAQSLARAAEFRDLARRLPSPVDATVVFCGTGEPLVHRRVTDYVRMVRDAGLACELSTNGALLSRDLGRALLDAGLQWVNVNVAELDADYEHTYGLPFARTREHVDEFVALARGRCVVCIIVVDHRRDEAHLRAVERYWRARGVDAVVLYGLVNRAGSLRIPSAALPRPNGADAAVSPLVCPAPFSHLFIGWDGRYYLCSQDWRKVAPLGSVFETSFAAITAAKLAMVRARAPLCAHCTLDPANLVRHDRLADDPTRSRPLDARLEDLVFSDTVARALAAQVTDAHAAARTAS